MTAIRCWLVGNLFAALVMGATCSHAANVPLAGDTDRDKEQSAVQIVVDRIALVDSGNNCSASNPLSTAVGLGQFIESEWIRTLSAHRPEMVAGRTKTEILALRTDCQISLDMLTAVTLENGVFLKSRNLPVTPGSLYIAHFLGPGGAATVMTANRDALVSDALGTAITEANPFLKGKTIEFLMAWAERKMQVKLPEKNNGNSN